jgi:hypothetical protein
VTNEDHEEFWFRAGEQVEDPRQEHEYEILVPVPVRVRAETADQAQDNASKMVMSVLHHDDRLPDHVYYGRVQRVDGVYQPEEPGDPEPLDLSEILDREGAE